MPTRRPARSRRPGEATHATSTPPGTVRTSSQGGDGSWTDARPTGRPGVTKGRPLSRSSHSRSHTRRLSISARSSQEGVCRYWRSCAPGPEARRAGGAGGASRAGRPGGCTRSPPTSAADSPATRRPGTTGLARSRGGRSRVARDELELERGLEERQPDPGGDARGRRPWRPRGREAAAHRARRVQAAHPSPPSYSPNGPTLGEGGDRGSGRAAGGRAGGVTERPALALRTRCARPEDLWDPLDHAHLVRSCGRLENGPHVMGESTPRRVRTTGRGTPPGCGSPARSRRGRRRTRCPSTGRSSPW